MRNATASILRFWLWMLLSWTYVFVETTTLAYRLRKSIGIHVFQIIKKSNCNEMNLNSATLMFTLLIDLTFHWINANRGYPGLTIVNKLATVFVPKCHLDSPTYFVDQAFLTTEIQQIQLRVITFTSQWVTTLSWRFYTGCYDIFMFSKCWTVFSTPEIQQI